MCVTHAHRHCIVSLQTFNLHFTQFHVALLLIKYLHMHYICIFPSSHAFISHSLVFRHHLHCICLWFTAFVLACCSSNICIHTISFLAFILHLLPSKYLHLHCIYPCPHVVMHYSACNPYSNFVTHRHHLLLHDVFVWILAKSGIWQPATLSWWPQSWIYTDSHCHHIVDDP